MVVVGHHTAVLVMVMMLGGVYRRGQVRGRVRIHAGHRHSQGDCQKHHTDQAGCEAIKRVHI